MNLTSRQLVCLFILCMFSVLYIFDKAIGAVQEIEASEQPIATSEIKTYDMGDGVRCYTLPGVPSMSCVQVWKQFAE